MLKPSAYVRRVKSDVTNKISARFRDMALKWEVNITNLIVGITAIVTVTMFVNTDHNSVNHLSDTVNDLKISMEKQFSSVRGDIANLPNVSAQQHADENLIATLSTTVNSMVDKVSSLDKRTGVVEDRLHIRQPRD